jgi:tRNA(Ile)-lysidine synthase
VVGLAVSGGSDSLALLHLARDWAQTRGRKIRAASVDHGLRPEAAGEARDVGTLCARLGVEHDILTWRPGAHPISQARAREARYGLLARWARDHAVPAIALGHTRDDRIETFLIRLRAGSTWYGLAGPMPAAPCPLWPAGEGVTLLRPLLAFGREELRSYLSALGQAWIDDPGNQARRHERVRMRALTQRVSAHGQSSILRHMNRMAALRSAISSEARQCLTAHVTVADEEALVETDAFRSMSVQGGLRLAEALILAMGGQAVPPRHEALVRVVDRLRTREGLSRGQTLAGAWLRETRGQIRITPSPPRTGALRAAPSPSPRRAQALLTDPLISTLYVRE